MFKKHKLDKYYMDKYGICWAQRMLIWKNQRGRCAICLKHERRFKRRLAVDHDHKTKAIRGLLCFYCNKFLVGRHNVWTALLVYEYLKRDHENTLPVP